MGSDDITISEFPIKYICDNKNLIDNCIERFQYTIPFPNTYLLPEFDLIDEIFQTNKNHHITPSFFWIKGHQDDLTNEEELQLEAKLNIEADHFAKAWNNNHGTIKTDLMTIMVPSNSAALFIQGSLISSKYYKRLNEAYTLPRYHSYLQMRFKWNALIINNIAWECFYSVINKINCPVLMTKISNMIL